MATFDDFFGQWKTAISDAVTKSYGDFLTEAKSDADAFFTEAKADLAKWTDLLATKAINGDEFASLVKSDEDLLELHALKQAGLAEARWSMFIDTVIETTISVALKVFL
jgi:hypothetical protein